MALIVAIESSQRLGGVAGRRGDGEVRVEPFRDGPGDDLVAAIDRVVRGLGARPREIDAIGVSIGPGSFTGLRTAVAAAKMLGEALGAALIAIPTALVAAEAADLPREVRRALVALAVKRGDAPTAWITRLDRDAEGRWAAAPGALARLDAIDLAADAVVAEAAFAPELAAAARCAGIEWREAQPSPESCLAVAARLRAAGCRVDPMRLAPLYPREPEAAILWAARGGA